MKKVDIKYTKLFIDNEWVDAVSKKTFTTFNPQDESPIAQVAEGDKADVDKAVLAAKRAFHRHAEWRTMDASRRGEIMHKMADIIDREATYIAELETLNNGKPFTMAHWEVSWCSKILRYYGGMADKLHGKTIPADGGVMAMTTKEPVGICGQIIPWNYPFTMAIWKIAPAFAAGCCVILKPAEQTPLTALVLGAIAIEAGLPKGVLNIINGYGPTAGAAITEHPGIDKVAFTGSTEIGKLITSNSVKTNLKRITMELGGKSAIVVFDDADVDTAVKIAHEGLFVNAGQCCAAASRTYVQAGIYEKFIAKAAELAKSRKLGNSFEKDVVQGPQIDKEMFEKVLGYVEAGKKDGARVLTGGKRFGTKGFFIEPTVFADVTDNMKISREEIFGPVQCISKFNTFEEVIDRVNDSNYGLGAGVVTNDVNISMAFVKHARAGTVWVNTFMQLATQIPFGGFKESGFGRELGEDGIQNYLETKSIIINHPNKL